MHYIFDIILPFPRRFSSLFKAYRARVGTAVFTHSIPLFLKML